ncbi:MAG: hypothetical protein C4542_00415 [Dehalococcoidia bacterium]|nr:MAG: hypothetical protein C4542_00415 [Dehalococcoidia bacterium]
MKKWLLGIVTVVLLAGSGTNTYFYIQQNNRLNQVDERIAGLLTSINSVQNGLTSLQGNVSTLGDSVSSLSTNVGTLGGKITDLQGTTSGLSSDVNTLKGNITTINGNITTINGSITSVNTSVTALQNSVSGMQSSVTALQASAQAVANVVSKVEPTVVKIISSVSGGYSGGTGVIVRSNGYILTNYHVINGALSTTVTLKTGEFFSASVVTFNAGLDIAILKLNSTRTDFPFATLGSSAAAQVGDDVIAIGYPELFELPGQATFTKGIISAFRNMSGYRFIQTDAAINHGNSGGPLVNLKGEVIGINSQRLFWDDSSGDPVDNIGFAIPIDDAKYLIP